MAQSPATTQPADPAFVSILSADITGRFITHTTRFSDEDVVRNFRAAVEEPHLLANEPFMHNLMFLVRKRDIAELHDDVRDTLLHRGMPRRAIVSTMKTLYALGDEEDRVTVDDRLHTALRRQLERPDALERTDYVEWADRIGGPMTVNALREFVTETDEKIKQVRDKTPDDFATLANLDSLKTQLVNAIDAIERKAKIMEMPVEKRTPVLVELYLSRAGHLGFWAYKVLVDDPTPEALAAAKDFVAQKINTLLPAGGIDSKERAALALDYRLRGICLLEAMKADISEEQKKLLEDNAAMLAEREMFFRPKHDWEDVLDRK